MRSRKCKHNDMHLPFQCCAETLDSAKSVSVEATVHSLSAKSFGAFFSAICSSSNLIGVCSHLFFGLFLTKNYSARTTR